MGDGLKHESQKYYPIDLPKMIEDFEEKKCQVEPNPTAEWLKQKTEFENRQRNKP